MSGHKRSLSIEDIPVGQHNKFDIPETIPEKQSPKTVTVHAYQKRRTKSTLPDTLEELDIKKESRIRLEVIKSKKDHKRDPSRTIDEVQILSPQAIPF